MFDNNMNNGDNNTAPLFDNKNVLNSQNNINGTNQNQPLFNPSMSNNYNFYSSAPSVEIDTPPKLDDIKNLSDATITSGPSLDVLGPINLMPETVNPPKQDPLDAYEAGDYNILNNPVASDINTLNSNNLVPNDINALNTNNLVPNDTNALNLNNNLINDNISYDYKTDESTNINSINNINEVGVLSSQDFKNDNIVENEENVVSTEEEKDANINDDILFKTDDNKEKTEKTTILPKELEENEQNNEKVDDKAPDEKDYKIIQDDDLNEEENQDLSSLGLDESYEEPDLLEIMDLESEDESKSEDNESDLSATKGLEQIKELINKLKEKGINVELQEFDFDKFYQLIVKLDK